MLEGPYIYLVFTSLVFNPVLGDFKTRSISLAPVIDIGDGSSLFLKIYPCRFWWIRRYQLITLNRDVTGENSDLGSMEVRCNDFVKPVRELTLGFINIGNKLFVSAVKSEPVKVILKLKKECHQTIFNGDSLNRLQKAKKEVLTMKECIAKINKIKPKKVNLGSKIKILKPNSKTSNNNNMKYQPQYFTGHYDLSIQKTNLGEIVATGPATGVAGPVVIATKEQAAQPVRRMGRGGIQPPMTMLSLDSSDIDDYIAMPREAILWYLSDQLVMVLQDVHRGRTCIRSVTVAKMVQGQGSEEDDVELARFKTTCGKVEGLTMYRDLIKYQKGFVMVIENENEASGYFNLRPNNCLHRKYTINGGKIEWTDVNQDSSQCKSLISDTTGSIFNKFYKDNDHGLLGEGVYMEYIPNTSSPKEEEDKRVEEESKTNNKQTWIVLGLLRRWFGI